MKVNSGRNSAHWRLQAAYGSAGHLANSVRVSPGWPKVRNRMGGSSCLVSGNNLLALTKGLTLSCVRMPSLINATLAASSSSTGNWCPCTGPGWAILHCIWGGCGKSRSTTDCFAISVENEKSNHLIYTLTLC
ncbi:unnamed protein product [Meganyctiphanes norvegica]|uniref:Uncharacterized protein n=1 Tax=Meganyctiphanes norvegica TaxID=48144 RepID=A0AAV2S8P1_MEGNR